jgi:hypothetical protein
VAKAAISRWMARRIDMAMLCGISTQVIIYFERRSRRPIVSILIDRTPNNPIRSFIKDH